MPALKPFRFAVAMGTAVVADFHANARRAEELGFARVGIGDHFSAPFEPGPALTALALATTNVRIGTVFDDGFRHPALLAKAAASIDVLSGGRLEFAIGAGWKKAEYDQIGLPFDPPGVRVGRLIGGTLSNPANRSALPTTGPRGGTYERRLIAGDCRP
jgi:alkanesulfonate monooxygenase SsuD/methylene tetrahydromethanopterin reductase-like flavin-dependent oxidoreductase (luciferase family)